MAAFHLTLPSGSSKEYFPDNATSAYITKLPQRFDLGGDWRWQMCLTELIVPKNCLNIRRGLNEVAIYRLTVSRPERMWIPKRVFDVPPGQYKGVGEIIKIIQSKLNRKGTKRKIKKIDGKKKNSSDGSPGKQGEGAQEGGQEGGQEDQEDQEEDQEEGVRGAESFFDLKDSPEMAGSLEADGLLRWKLDQAKREVDYWQKRDASQLDRFKNLHAKYAKEWEEGASSFGIRTRRSSNKPPSFKGVKIEHDPKQNRVKIETNSGYGLHLGGDILTAFGFSNIITVKKNQAKHRVIYGSFTGADTPYANRIADTMYVYSDLAQQVVVGDYSVGLLRVLDYKNHMDGEEDGCIARDFRELYYTDVKFNNFDSIGIQICDRFGNLVEFLGPEVIAIVHFRPKKRD